MQPNTRITYWDQAQIDLQQLTDWQRTRVDRLANRLATALFQTPHLAQARSSSEFLSLDAGNVIVRVRVDWKNEALHLTSIEVSDDE